MASDNVQVNWKEVPFNPHNLFIYCLWYKDAIFVRHYNKFLDQWENRPISEIPGGELLEHIEKWIHEERYPHRLIEKDEPVEKPHE
jgi:hypothetical protein